MSEHAEVARQRTELEHKTLQWEVERLSNGSEAAYRLMQKWIVNWVPQPYLDEFFRLWGKPFVDQEQSSLDN